MGLRPKFVHRSVSIRRTTIGACYNRIRRPDPHFRFDRNSVAKTAVN